RTLTLRTRVEHGVRLGERMLRTALRLELIDDGAGIPAALRDTLFEPLVSGRADGTGLGLALSREIAREHGGELRDAGLAVREFGDAEAARAALRDERPALLLTDVRMPGEDGLSLLHDLQQRA